jgi:predicted ABC-type transport system involved in lysophospholipase L1 biosynthesis ATPase subunit
VLKERLAGGTALVIVTHDAEQGARLGGRRFLMRDRRLEAVA